VLEVPASAIRQEKREKKRALRAEREGWDYPYVQRT
jgi:hypothetical protein